MNLRYVKLLFAYMIVGVLFFTVSAPSVSAQACGSAVTVDRFLCTQVLDGGGNIISCQPNYTRQTNVPCNTSTCMTTSDVCSSNDISKCSPQNGCSPLPCSPASCGGAVSTPGGCPAECRQGSSCGAGYSSASGCSGSGVGGGCTSLQTCCKANFCGGSGGNGGTCGFEQTNCPAGYVKNSTVSGTQCRPISDNTCAGVGNAQINTGVCCHSTKTEPSVCGDWYSCPTPSNPSKVCRDCTDEVWECDSYTVNTYQCVSTAPTCTPTPPTFRTITSYTPTGNVTGTTQTLLWTSVQSWGNACNGGTSQYLVYLSTSPTNITSTTPIYTGTGTTTQFTTGVPGTTYYWVVVATNGQQSVTSPTNSFSIQNKTITGTVYYDPNNICSGSGWSSGGVSVSLDGGAGTAVSGAGAFSFTVNDSASHTLGTSIPSNMTCSSCSTCFRGGIFSPSSNLFYLTDSRSAWWQVEGAPVYSGSTAGGTTIRSELPTASTPLILPGTGGTSGALLRASGISPDLGSGVVSDDLWNTIAKYRGKKMDYAYFAANMGLLSTTPQLNNTGAKPTSGSDFYFKNADYNINSVWNVSGSESYVVFVNGDLNVNANTTVAPGGFLAYIVSGDINIASSVTQLEGIFLSTGSFNTITVDPTHTIDDVALSIEGSVIAWGSVNFNRDINTLNVTTPAEKVTYRTDLLENMPDNMKIFAMEWSEVVSGTLAD